MRSKQRIFRRVTDLYMYPMLYCEYMPAPTRRVRRPIGTETVAVHLFLTPDVKNRIDTYARHADVPQWAIVEAAILAGEPDSETGIPKGWDLPDSAAAALPGVTDGGGAVRSSP